MNTPTHNLPSSCEPVHLTEGELHVALTHRDIIGQAKGILMERHHVSSVEAWGLLRRLSMDTNCRVYDIAERLVRIISEEFKSEEFK